MTLRHHQRLRSIASMLPIIGAYERRVAGLTARVHECEAALEDGAARLREREAQLSASEARLTQLFAPPGHFYSPHVDVEDVRARETQVFGGDPALLSAIDLRLEAQWALFDQLSPTLRDIALHSTREEAVAAGRRYWSLNPAFGDGDATVLTAILRHLRPSRLIELGCGYSSACTLDARDEYLDGALQITFCDPFPELLDSLVTERDRTTATFRRDRTQDVVLDLLAELGDGDVLFIDSTHVAKTGSDVNRIFADILPALRPGVVVHLHDIFPGFEYPPSWVYEHRGWNEQYMLRSFLQYNDAFEILLWPTLLRELDPARVAKAMPRCINGGGSFWFRKVG
jgi:predicted O-methyltransferase YrrM